MKLAIIQTGGKQYLVKANDKIQIEKIAGNVGETIKLSDVLLISEGSNISVGKPTLTTPIEVKILKQARSNKVIVFKYKAKSKYRRKLGHRQDYTEVQI